MAAPRVYVTPGARPTPPPDIPAFDPTPAPGTTLPPTVTSSGRRPKGRPR